jgi:peptide subunit release factor 1 (eRF1)
VWKLVYVRGLSVEGQECGECGGLFTMAEEKCPQCGNTLHHVKAFVDRLSHRVIEAGGSVEVVSGPAAETLRQVGDIAAILRG